MLPKKNIQLKAPLSRSSATEVYSWSRTSNYTTAFAANLKFHHNSNNIDNNDNNNNINGKLLILNNSFF